MLASGWTSGLNAHAGGLQSTFRSVGSSRCRYARPGRHWRHVKSYSAPQNANNGFVAAMATSSEVPSQTARPQEMPAAPAAADWHCEQTLQLGRTPDEHAAFLQQRVALLARVQQHAQQRPSHVHLRLACLKGSKLDVQATADLHNAVYSILGSSVKNLSIHVQRPELCGAAELLPSAVQVPQLESLRLLVSPVMDKPAQAQGQPTMEILAGLRGLKTLKELSIWCPAMLPPMEQLLPQLPPSLRSLSITQFPLAPHGPPAPQPAAQRTYASWAASGLKMLEQRAQLERLLAMEVPQEGAEAPWVQAQLLPALKQLHLSGMDLTCGPTWQWLSSLEHLEALSLASCPIEELPPLPTLRSLTLRDSGPPGSLQALPAGTTTLPCLEELTLSVNGDIHGRTVSLRELEHTLRSLSISGAGLFVLPPDLAACTALTSLHLGYTDADSARIANHDLSALSMLRHLSARHCLPSGLEALPHLVSLELQDVDLSSGSSQGSAAAEEEAAKGLCLMTLCDEDSGVCWEELVLCDAWEEPAEQRGADAAAAKGLPLLRPASRGALGSGLDGYRSSAAVPLRPLACALEAAPAPLRSSQAAPGLPSLPDLESLTLRDCCVPALPEGLHSLSRLAIHGGEAPALVPLPSLAQLSLQRCRLGSVPEAALAAMTNLTSLDLSGNAGLQGALPPLPALQSLELSDCSLDELPEGLEGLQALEQLVLDSNIGLSAELPPLLALKHLSLQDCGLFELPEGLTGLSSLESIDLRGNVCCELSPDEEAWLLEQVGRVDLEW